MLTHNEIEVIARTAAKEASMSPDDIRKLVAEAVKQTLLQLGVDPSNPLEMQADFQHLRAWRKAGQELRTKGLVTLLGILLTGTGALIVLGLKGYFK